MLGIAVHILSCPIISISKSQIESTQCLSSKYGLPEIFEGAKDTGHSVPTTTNYSMSFELQACPRLITPSIRQY